MIAQISGLVNRSKKGLILGLALDLFSNKSQWYYARSSNFNFSPHVRHAFFFDFIVSLDRASPSDVGALTQNGT